MAQSPAYICVGDYFVEANKKYYTDIDGICRFYFSYQLLCIS